MPTGRPPKTLLPIHLHPKDDELLSSWLARLAVAYETKPDIFYSLLIPQKPRFPARLDETCGDDVLLSVVRATQVELKRVRDTTLTQYEDTFRLSYISGNLDERYRSYQWIMPASYPDSPNQLFGLQYCPHCLSSDEMPYFRRRWRFAFVTLCETHQVLLLDRCTRCGLPVDFRRNGSRVRKKQHPTLTMTECYSCRFDIRTAAAPSPRRNVFTDGIKYQKALLKSLGKDAVVSPKGEMYTLTSYFYTLYELLTLLAFGGFGKFTRNQLCKRYKIGTFTITQPEPYKRIELLNVKERFGLLRVGSRVLFEWPDDLMSFSWPNDSRWSFPGVSPSSTD